MIITSIDSWYHATYLFVETYRLILGFRGFHIVPKDGS